jgi:glycosyltransferase involved in cell wall biosynthesis
MISVSQNCGDSMPRPADREWTYTLITAAHNEQDYIEETIQSVLLQTLRPRVWVIVSDGSTDRTDEIVLRYSAANPFIHLVRREKDENRGFASKVFAIRAGIEYLGENDTEYIAHLDADIALGPKYFEDVLTRCQRDPSLGIAGGWYSESVNGLFSVVPGSSTASVPGCMQVFRRSCYKEIGGLLPIEYGGEDWYAEVMARKAGWRVQSFPEVLVRHLRETGTASNKLQYCFHQGVTDFCLGSHPAFEMVKVAKRMMWRPYILGGGARLLGFLFAHVSKRRAVSEDFVTFLRREQLSRLGFLGTLLHQEI